MIEGVRELGREDVSPTDGHSQGCMFRWVHMPRVLTWWNWQVRFWDTASFEEVRRLRRKMGTGKIRQQPTVSEFAFVAKTNQHLLKARGDTLLITELPPIGALVAPDLACPPVACFKAPGDITSVRCHGATICVGCQGGAVCILQAPFLAV